MILETFPVGPLACNCSIVADELTREAMVIDPGEDVSHILRRLAAHQFTLKQIVITHAHIDHVGGAARLKQMTNAPIVMNAQDLPLLNMIDKQAAWLGVTTPEIFTVDSSAEDLAVIGLPALLGQILHTPGHTPGSICLYFASEQLLFSGDTLFAGTIGRTDLGGDSRMLLRSLRERLLPLPENTRVLPGHGRATMIGEERQSNPFLRPVVQF